MSGSGTAACPWSLSLADFLEFEALRAALDDEFELLVAALNARLRRVDRCSADWRAALVAEHGLSHPTPRPHISLQPSTSFVSTAPALPPMTTVDIFSNC